MKTLLLVLLLASSAYARSPAQEKKYQAAIRYHRDKLSAEDTKSARKIGEYLSNERELLKKEKGLRIARHYKLIKDLPKKDRVKFQRAEGKYVVYMLKKKKKPAQALARKYGFSPSFYQYSSLVRVGKHYHVKF